VTDSSVPSPDHTYTVRLRVTAGDAIISQLGIATVTVVASNDPFGVFGFGSVGTHFFPFKYFLLNSWTVPRFISFYWHLPG